MIVQSKQKNKIEMNILLKFLGISVVANCIQLIYCDPIVKAEDFKCAVCESNGDGEFCALKFKNDTIQKCDSGKCYTKVENGKLYRGCIGDAIVPNEKSLESCKAIKRCNMCNETICNNRKVHDQCIQCDSSQDSNCKSNPAIQMQVYCSVSFDFSWHGELHDIEDHSDGCYLDISGGIYKRGCIQDLNKSKLEQCRDIKNKECQICTHANCNKKIDFDIECYECNEKVNSGCADATKLQKTKLCGFNDTCVTGFSEFNDNRIARGCIEDHKDFYDLFYPFGYTKCHEKLCNNQPYSTGVLECYQCEGSNCKNVTSIKPQKCAAGLHYYNDRCYTYIKGGKI